MAAKIVKKFFHSRHAAEDAGEGGKEEEEGGGGPSRSTRFADADPTASPGGAKKKPGKKEVRVQEPANEDGEQQRARSTGQKKKEDKKGPPSVSLNVKERLTLCLFFLGVALE